MEARKEGRRQGRKEGGLEGKRGRRLARAKIMIYSVYYNPWAGRG